MQLNEEKANCLKVILKIIFFEADNKLNPQFTEVNEEFNFEVERRKSNL